MIRIENVHYMMIARLVNCGLRVRSGGKTDTVVRRVKDGIEPLEESISVDEVKTSSAIRAKLDKGSS